MALAWQACVERIVRRARLVSSIVRMACVASPATEGSVGRAAYRVTNRAQ